MKKLFGCVCVCQMLLPVLLVLCTIAGLKANNIRVEGKTRLVNFVGTDTAVIEVNLRWDNSWRDDFNWDAAWVFFKFKKRGLENPWQHAYLGSSGHVLSASAGNEGGGYAYMAGTNGGKVNGLYVMRNSISEGNVSVRLQVKWPLSGTGLTKSDFGDALDKIYVAAHAIEMVYIPYGAYYLGDAASHLCFHEYFAPDRNPIRLNGYESISASSLYSSSYKLESAIDADINTHYHSAGRSNEWFMIDFGTPKTMRYFTIRTHYGGTGYFVEGSNDGSNWSTLWSGSGSAWSTTQSKHKITNPGAYQYYRFRETGNYLVIYDVALMEDAFPVAVDSEDALTLCLNGENSFVSLAASYPKGYAGFYVMKYETSQEQYVEFLNSLTLEQQKARVANNNFSTMKKGDYVFGELKTPSCRNGIAFVEQKQPDAPVVFGNNLNPGNDFFSTDDGQTLACNYMSVEDMIAYCSWSGLRPMSELEYEKACRRFYPQEPDRGEYAWNTNNGVNALSSLGDLAYAGDEREQANSVAKNVNSGIGNKVNGPVRCGLFGTSATNQSQSGATYWGVMEMSGNLRELCVNVNYANLDGGSCGMGVYNADLWDKTANKYGVRGGGFSSADSSLRTSDRSEVMNYFTAITQRDSTVGFRGVYSLSGIKIDGGEIQGDTTCPKGEATISNVKAAFCPDFPDMRFQYNWYVKKPGEAMFELIENASEATLTYTEFENTGSTFLTYQFKRTGICAMGVAETVAEMYVAPLPWTETKEMYANVYPSFQVNIHPIWKEMLQTAWVLNNHPAGISIAANRGVVSGLADNSIFMAEVTVSAEKCPGQEWTKTLEVIRQFDYTGTEQSITLKPGDYKMECWGASGSNLTTSVFGKGAYVKGDVHLNTSKIFCIFVGGVNGYNGGGDANYLETSGGGATDIRLLGGVWNDFESLKSRILIAGGGGGLASGTTQRGASGGAGGGLTGYNGTCPSNRYLTYGRGATQTSGGAHGAIESTPLWYGSTAGSFAVGGKGTTRYNGGGGGGFYGGGGAGISSANYTGGGGGSSFISGHNGCNAIHASSTSGNIIHTGQSKHYSGLYFTNTVMIDGAGYQWATVKGGYVGMPNLTDTDVMPGNTGHGQVKIRPVN